MRNSQFADRSRRIRDIFLDLWNERRFEPARFAAFPIKPIEPEFEIEVLEWFA